MDKSIKNNTYTAFARCTNCGKSGNVTLEKGTPVFTAVCPNCKCTSVLLPDKK